MLKKKGKKSKTKTKKVLSRRPYSTGSSKLDKHIHQLVAMAGGHPDENFLREIIITALRIGQDDMESGDIKMINASMKELRYALHVFKKYRPVRKVAIFGSARTPSSAPEFKQARAFAKGIAKAGWMVITGAADGIMRAGNEGAGRAKSFGVNIRLPFEQEANPVILDDSKLINFKYFFTRKLIFMRESDATVLCPGGFGTHDEGFETLTLVQTGKATPRPIVCLDPSASSYWKSWRRFVKKELAGKKLIDKGDLGILYFTHEPKDAVAYIKKFYSNYHSMRYVKNTLVIRVKRLLPQKELKKLNAKFKDILRKGEFTQYARPFDEEDNEPYTHHLNRLAFHFTRRDFARLYDLIQVINQSYCLGAFRPP